MGEGDNKLYGTIEIHSNPWRTNPWKDLGTKEEINRMKVMPFVNFCDETLSSRQILHHLFNPDPPLPSTYLKTLEELVLRALLLLPDQHSLFSSTSPFYSTPVNCLNFLLSSPSGFPSFLTFLLI
jgi:hypothetical protein